MTFKAFVGRKTTDGYICAFEDLEDDALPTGERVTINVAWSSLNYKDGLAVTARGRIFRRFPMVPGIDLAGTVTHSDSDDLKPGDLVLGTGQGLGETEWGGFTQRQRVLRDALIRVPDGMTLEQSMQLGTAGLTAMMALLALDRYGVQPDDREVVVTGASGGVGSLAVMLLASRGYKVAAVTGRPELESYLRDLGATSIVTREELASASGPLQSERWSGGIDTVGGAMLSNLYAQTAYGGAIACCGMAASHELNATVWPMILRNVSLLGVSTLKPSQAVRNEAWEHLAAEVDFEALATVARTEPLSAIVALSEEIVEGRVQGRVALDTAG